MSTTLSFVVVLSLALAAMAFARRVRAAGNRRTPSRTLWTGTWPLPPGSLLDDAYTYDHLTPVWRVPSTTGESAKQAAGAKDAHVTCSLHVRPSNSFSESIEVIPNRPAPDDDAGAWRKDRRQCRHFQGVPHDGDCPQRLRTQAGEDASPREADALDRHLDEAGIDHLDANLAGRIVVKTAITSCGEQHTRIDFINACLSGHPDRDNAQSHFVSIDISHRIEDAQYRAQHSDSQRQPAGPFHVDPSVNDTSLAARGGDL